MAVADKQSALYAIVSDTAFRQSECVRKALSCVPPVASAAKRRAQIGVRGTRETSRG